MFAFEYGRLMLYKKEQALLAEYLLHQQEMDQKLETEHQNYMKDLNAQADNFEKLIRNAFDPNFTDTLKASVELALAAGVDKSEVLTSIGDIDAFFLN